MNLLSIMELNALQRRFLLVILDFFILFCSLIVFSDIFINSRENLFICNFYIYALFITIIGIILFAISNINHLLGSH